MFSDQQDRIPKVSPVNETPPIAQSTSGSSANKKSGQSNLLSSRHDRSAADR